LNISVVIPALNEADTLEALCARTVEILSKIAPLHEVIVIDDGSTDGTTAVLEKLRKRYGTVRAIGFPSNRGKTAALVAGFQEARGDVIITMDGDLQNDPDDIPLFIAALQKGQDLVCGWRWKRQDPLMKVLVSYVFNCFLRLTCKTAIHDINCGFKAFNKRSIEGIRFHKDEHRFIPILVEKRGGRVSEIRIRHHPRRFGASKYSTFRYKAFFDIVRLVFRGTTSHN